MLRDRVLAIRHGNVFDPHTYRHVVSLPRFAPGAAPGPAPHPAPGPAAATGAQAASGTELACARRVLTSFNVTRVMKTGEMMLFAAGTYDDVFVEIDSCLMLDSFSSRLCLTKLQYGTISKIGGTMSMSCSV